MEYQNNCGKESTDNEKNVQNVVAASTNGDKEGSFAKSEIAFMICSVVEMISVFLGWIRINLFNISKVAISPFAFQRKLNDLMDAWGSYLPDQIVRSVSVITIGVFLLLVLHAVALVLTMKKHTSAYLAGMFANLAMLLFGGTFVYEGRKMESATYGVVSVLFGGYMALVLAIVGLCLFIKLFSEQKKSIPDAFGYMMAGLIIECIPFMTGMKALGLM